MQHCPAWSLWPAPEQRPDSHSDSYTYSDTDANPPADVERLNVQVISSELSVGANRMVFALLDNDLKPILGVTAELSTFYPAESSLGEPQQKVPAHFRKWPLGDIGVYTAQLDFQQAGTWGLRVEATGSDGSALVGAVGFVVAEESSSPAIGAQGSADQEQNEPGRRPFGGADLRRGAGPRILFNDY